MYRSGTAADPPPLGLTVYRGVRSAVLGRPWVWFLLHHPVAKQGRPSTATGGWRSACYIRNAQFYSAQLYYLFSAHLTMC